MRRHAKASPAGSTSSRGNALGSIHLVLVALCSLLALTLLTPAANAAPGTKGVVSWIGTDTFGTLGGQFIGPTGVAVNDTSGDVYVADRFNNRIQQFSSSGAFIRAWGFDVIQPGKPGDLGNEVFEVCTVAADCKEGIGFVSPAPGGELSSPQGIAIDQSDGSVYVYEEFTRVQKFSSTGAFQLAFGKDVDTGGGAGAEVCTTAANCKAGEPGTLGGEFGFTFFGLQLAVVPAGAPNAGNVIVADPANRRVQEFTSAGTFVRTFGFDVAGAGAGADNTGTEFEVCTQTVAGAANCQAGTAGSGIGQFASSQPRSVAADTTGAIYAVESESNNRVQKFTPQAGPPPLAPTVFAEAQLSGSPGPTDVAVDPSNNHVYVTKPSFSPSDRQVRQLDPAGALQFTHGAGSDLTNASGLAVKAGDGPIYQSSSTGGQRVYILDNLTPPTAELDTPAITAITSTSAMLHGKVNPNGPPDVSYRFEYSLNGTDWSPASTPDTLLGSQVTTQSVSELLKPGVGLEPNTLYHVRVVATRPFNAPVASASTTFKTLAGAPIAETTGAPVRTTTTAQLNGRFVAFNSPTDYHFEYGLTDSYGQSTPTQPGGSDPVYQLVTEEITGLEPNTTYHYRLVADNGASGSPVFGEDMTVTTRASDEPLTHGDFPGPVGSDRAWEMVSQPDTSGNPATTATAISDDGNRVVYMISGGAEHSESSSIFNQLFAERTPKGWQTNGIFPKRAEANAPTWGDPTGKRDLSEFVGINYSFTGVTPTSWRMFPDKPAEKVFGIPATEWGSGVTVVSDDASRVAWGLTGPQDPDYPVAPGVEQLYDVTSGEPHLISLMPDGSVPACPIEGIPTVIQTQQRRKWITEDGSHAFFGSRGNNSCGSSSSQLYVRDIEAEATDLVSGPPASGLNCEGLFIKSTPGAGFFLTASRLVAEDSTPTSCFAGTGKDVYRYDLGNGSLDCVTCVVSGVDANVNGEGPYFANQYVGVSEDGSHVYFIASSRLVPGAAARGIYRVNVSSQDLDYIGAVLPEVAEFAGDSSSRSNAITRDGSSFIFKSSNPRYNALNGQSNGGTNQYYRYDGDDGSIICVSCPQDGGIPIAEVKQGRYGNIVTNTQQGPNTEPLDAKGNFLFTTPTPLVTPDQNTSFTTPYVGNDVYEWRDGRLLLVSDGLTNWARRLSFGVEEIEGPEVAGFTPSGRDAFFTVPAQYTRDALDGFRRVYDARIGGGIEFPPPPPPCPLEVCQGTPKGAPEEAAPGTRAFSGPSNVQEAPQQKRCGKGKRKVRRAGKTRCVKRQAPRQRRANHNRRTAR